MILFFIGIIEMLVISTWTKVVTETKVVVSGMVTVVNIFIWYYVLQTMVNDIHNFWVVGLYAAGCAVGTMLSTAYFRFKEKREAI